MTDTAQVVLDVSWSEPQLTHYVCCSISENFSGMTTTFCGELVLTDQVQRTGVAGCEACRRIVRRDGCPLGRWCEVGG